jgi:hypothetical protein
VTFYLQIPDLVEKGSYLANFSPIETTQQWVFVYYYQTM